MEPGLGWAMLPSATPSEKQRSLPYLLQEHFPLSLHPPRWFPDRLFISKRDSSYLSQTHHGGPILAFPVNLREQNEEELG